MENRIVFKTCHTDLYLYDSRHNFKAKKTPVIDRGWNWCIAKGIKMWGLPVMRCGTPGTVNLHTQDTYLQVKKL